MTDQYSPIDEPEFHPVPIGQPVTFNELGSDLGFAIAPEPSDDEIRQVPNLAGLTVIQQVISGQLRADAAKLAGYINSTEGEVKFAADELARIKGVANDPAAHATMTDAAIKSLPAAEARLARSQNALVALKELHDKAAAARPGVAAAVKKAIAERDALAAELNERYGPIVEFFIDIFDRIRACENTLVELKAMDDSVDVRTVEAVATGTNGKIYVAGRDETSLAATIRLPALADGPSFSGIAPRRINPAKTPLNLEVTNNSGAPVAVHGPVVQTIIPSGVTTTVTVVTGGLNALSADGITAKAV